MQIKYYMKIGIPKEIYSGEKRVALVPETAKKLITAGAEVVVEAGLGLLSHISDEAYTKVGVTVSSNRDEILSSSDMVLRLRKPEKSEIQKLKKGSIHVSYLDPFNEKDLLEDLAKAGVSAVSMEMIPRSTRAQKMDALSSQASLAGYVAVVMAAEKLLKAFPMMTTPSGTIQPARVFIVGAGVAGLQAIATAKRLGARVEAFDTRPVVEEQVKSLGGKFVKIDLGETGQTAQGYAKELTAEQLQKQREGLAKVCAQADVVITTAQVFGRKAPVIITKEMVAGMKPGSVVVDLAVETGGNVEGIQLDQIIELNGVTLMGVSNLPGKVSFDASRMYSNNLGNFILEFWNKETKSFHLNLEDEIIKSALVAHQGEVLFKK